jgi:8-hydroxy-5-deazaflavin:NADPH oxidoreductase
MRVAVIGTGPIGGTLGRAFARGGHQVMFGSRHPEGSSAAGDTGATVASAEAAVKGSEVVVLALPGTAVDGLLRLYVALAVQQGHGRHLAFRMLTDPA